MSDRSKLRRAWNSIHQTEPISEGPEAGVVNFIEYLQPQFSLGASVLDAGCGRGSNALFLSRLGYTVYACDLSSVALQIAQARAGEAGLFVNFQASDLAQLPYPNDIFTAAICVHALSYNCKTEIIKGVHELWRVLQPNGWLYLDLLARDDAEYGRGEKLEEDTFLDPSGTPLHFSSRHEVDELAQGFSLDRLIRHEYTPSIDRKRVAWNIWAVKSSAMRK